MWKFAKQIIIKARVLNFGNYEGDKMTNEDKKDVRLIMGEVLEQIVLPQMQEIKDTLKKHDEQFKIIDGRFNGIDERLDGIDERLDGQEEKIDDLQISLNRVETLAKSEIKFVDDLSDRVLKLEKV
ncbi:TPA: hypothetical protein DD449_03240 [Candidatus Berkelbacteria bacterium]|nr:hypothetical protein [Candidatus Berkelbacteria bacterium]